MWHFLLLQDLTKEEKTEGVPALDDNTCGSQEEILFNPNVFTEFKLAGNQEVISGPCNIYFVLPSS